MATRISIGVLFGILVISAWVLGSGIQAGAETLKGRSVMTETKDEHISVNDEPGHVLGVQITEGLATFENGEIAKIKNHNIYDIIPGKVAQAIIYTIWTFEDGSTVVTRTQRLMVSDPDGKLSAKNTTELIKGSGRFLGIKGTGSATGKTFQRSEGEAMRSVNDFTWTYTLPTK
jgi:hypothetical protein